MSDKERTITVHGNYIEGNLKGGNIAGGDITINKSKANDETKVLLTQLLDEIKTLNEKVPDSQKVADIAEETNNIINESQRDEPRERKYINSLEEIKTLATTLGDVAKPVLGIVKMLAPLLI